MNIHINHHARRSGMADKISIRRAVPADARSIAELHIRSWRAAYADIVDTAYLQTLDAAAQEQRMLAPGSGTLTSDDARLAVFVAEAGGKICGWASAGPVREHSGAKAGAELYSIYLDPAFFGTGAGEKLLDACFAHVRAHGYDDMEVRALRGNARACRFYRRHGARLVRTGGTVEIGGKSYALARFRWDMRDAGSGL